MCGNLCGSEGVWAKVSEQEWSRGETGRQAEPGLVAGTATAILPVSGSQSAAENLESLALDPAANGQRESALTLHRRRPGNIRRRFLATLLHVGGLIAADAAALGALVSVFLLCRSGALGDGLAALAVALGSSGHLNLLEAGVALLLGLWVTGNYWYGDSRREPLRLLGGSALAMGLVFWSQLWSRPVTSVLGEYLLVAGAVWVALLADRVVVDVLLQKLVPRSITAPRTLFVGSARHCSEVRKREAFGWDRDYTYVGYLEPNGDGRLGGTGEVEQLAHLLDHWKVEWVVICTPLPHESLNSLADACAMVGCKLFSLPTWALASGVEARVIWRRGNPLVELTPRPLVPLPQVLSHSPQGFYARYGKRLLDIFGATVGLLLGALPVLAAAIAMRMESRGPALILQPRVGRGGRIFDVIKLRTMVPDAEAQGPRWASPDDPRITPVGRWVRRFRIDEIPQFVNVLLGQMSLVGPRPERPEFHDLIVSRYPDFAKRVAVKPGITGLAQIYGGYADSVESSRRKLAYDLRYVANLSFWLDLGLIFHTFRVILTGYGSR